MYSPLRSPHRSMRIFHCSDSLFMSSVAFAFTASADSNLVHFNADLIFGNKKKSHGARPGEYVGCCSTVISCLVKNVLTDRALCAGALSWSRSSTFLLTRSRRFFSKPPCSSINIHVHVVTVLYKDTDRI